MSRAPTTCLRREEADQLLTPIVVQIHRDPPDVTREIGSDAPASQAGRAGKFGLVRCRELDWEQSLLLPQCFRDDVGVIPAAGANSRCQLATHGMSARAD